MAGIPSFDDFIKGPSIAPAAAPAAVPNFDDFSKTIPDEQGTGFWNSFKAQLSGLNPIPAVKAWLSTPGEIAKSMDALHVLNDLDARASADPANKGLPRNKWKMPEPTGAEQAVIDRGMNAQLPSSSEGMGMTAPALTAAGQARDGDLAGAAGTLAGGYGPVVVGAALPKVVPLAKAGVAELKVPGTGAIIKGGANAAVGVGAMLTGSPEGLVLGAGKAAEGVADVAKAWAKRKAFLEDVAARARVPTPVPEIQPPAGSMTIQPEAAIAAPAAASPAPVPSVYAPPVSSTNPLPAPAPQPAWNPYAVTGPQMDSGALVTAAQRAAAADMQLARPPAPTPQAAPVAPAVATPAPPAAAPATPTTAPPAPADPAPAPATGAYDSSAQALADKYKTNAAAADETKAQWMFEHGITSDQLKPGQPFKDLVDQIPNPNAKSGKFTTRLKDPDHPDRVKAVAAVLDSKYANAAAAANAAKLDAAGVNFAAASKMTPEQLGVKTPLEAANTLFQLQKLSLAKTAPPVALPTPVPAAP